jgi:hypothetical protein
MGSAASNSLNSLHPWAEVGARRQLVKKEVSGRKL